jgi:hypothetical protein
MHTTERVLRSPTQHLFGLVPAWPIMCRSTGKSNTDLRSASCLHAGRTIAKYLPMVQTVFAMHAHPSHLLPVAGFLSRGEHIGHPLVGLFAIKLAAMLLHQGAHHLRMECKRETAKSMSE